MIVVQGVFGPSPQIGLSRGRRTLKVHLARRGTATVIVPVLILGQVSGCAQIETLFTGLEPGETVLDDKADGINFVVLCVNIPSRACCKLLRPFDGILDIKHNLIARVFAKIKEFYRDLSC